MGQPLLDGVDYRPAMLESPSLMESAFAVFANTLEKDSSGNVLNEKAAEKRAAQMIRSWMDRNYVVEPPFEDWEVELY